MFGSIMHRLKKIESILKENKQRLRGGFKVKKIGIFGSYVHGRQGESGDIDILVEFFEPIGWEFIDLKEYLERILNLPVDLVTPNSVKPLIRDKILKDVVFA